MHTTFAAGTTKAVELPDGRQLAWSQWGPDDGLPVLFCTGAGMSGSLAFGIDSLPDLGLRLLALDRPGLGRSTPDAGKTLRSWIEDVRYLVEQQEFRPVAAAGFSQGAPFAFALGGARIARAVAIAAGSDDFAAVPHLLSAEVAAMVQAVHDDPVGFEREVARTFTSEGLRKMIIGTCSERDRELYASDTFGAGYRQSLSEGFRQGAAGYARDLVNALSRWPIPPEHVTVPVDLWYGELDTSTSHSPDFGETLAYRLPNSRRHLFADEGGSILWTRAAEILTALKQRTLHQ